MSRALDAFRSRIDDVLLLAVHAAGDEGIDPEDFLEREVADSFARLSERGFIERDDEAAGETPE